MKILKTSLVVACFVLYLISCGKEETVFVPPSTETFKLNADGKMTYDAINPIFVSSCAGGSCHSANQSPALISNYAVAKANGAKIVSSVVNKTMPKSGSLSEVRINAIKQWQTDGFLEK